MIRVHATRQCFITCMICCYIIFVVNSECYSQFNNQLSTNNSTNGISFVEDLSWEQIVNKAKDEGKFIFVDCYATWCQPCKEMDKSVYENDTVASEMNDKFLSVKMQLDSTARDNSSVKRLYREAKTFVKNYNVSALPTYLFFSPDGKIIHRDQGKMNVKEFLSLVDDVQNPHKQLYTLIENAQKGELYFESLPKLAETLKNFNQDSLSNAVAKNYIYNYLAKMPNDQLLNITHLSFIEKHIGLIEPEDIIFNFYFKNISKIDSIHKSPGFSKEFVNQIISNGEVQPFLIMLTKKGENPDWNNMLAYLSDKYGVEFANRNVQNAKVFWYKKQKDWDHYTKALVKKMQSEDLDSIANIPGSLTTYVNGNAAEIFQYSNKKEELEVALEWSDYAIRKYEKGELRGGLLDTKANILYKLKRKDEALEVYKQVIELNPDYSIFFRCMEKNLITWLNALWSPEMEVKRSISISYQNRLRSERQKSFSEARQNDAIFVTNPNFTGLWKINYFKSNFFLLPGYAASKVLKIDHKSNILRMERFNLDPQQNEVRSFEEWKTDGFPVIMPTERSQTKVFVSNWARGSQILVVNSILAEDDKPEDVEIRKTQKFALSLDKKHLIVEQLTHVKGNAQPYSIVAVYDKAQ